MLNPVDLVRLIRNPKIQIRFGFSAIFESLSGSGRRRDKCHKGFEPKKKADIGETKKFICRKIQLINYRL